MMALLLGSIEVGTYQGLVLLAARTSLRGDVEVAHPAIFQVFDPASLSPRAP